MPLKILRVSIATLAVCVLILAVDLAILRYFPTSDRAWLDLFAVPMLNILAFAFYQGRALRRLGKSSPFLRGFQILGWAAMIAYLTWCRIRPQDVGWALAVVSEPIQRLTLNNLDFDAMKRMDPTFGLAARISKGAQGAVAAGLVTVAMLLVAACGGSIARRRHRIRGEAAIPA